MLDPCGQSEEKAYCTAKKSTANRIETMGLFLLSSASHCRCHLPWDKVPEGGRYICVLRDPLRALVSMYTFFEGWLMEPGAVDFEDFAHNLYLARTAPGGEGYLRMWEKSEARGAALAEQLE
jgi:hypothetical protein